MAITDGLLQIESQLARFRAYDELTGSNKVGEYIGVIARGARPKQPLPEAPPGFVDPRFDLDPRKVTRQYQILDEQLAFVMGHELGHHYLGHLPCTAAGGLTLADIGAVLANAVPAFNQPNEVAADIVGINNTLTMGSRRADYHLTEGGALLTMQFFAGLDQLTPSDILFGFERSHPPPQLRTPVIQQTAATWRATGGVGLPILSF
jgi:Zn-dependent protease with chaperone function